VTLGTCGIQQLGWATMRCAFTSEEGVGDTTNSYAYDGKRRHKWNTRPADYGRFWAPGDVVGVLLDLDAREARPWRSAPHSFTLSHTTRSPGPP
jgi:Kip1 ubiquitination-promoting complex protein 1